jgi:hypothetical protein
MKFRPLHDRPISVCRGAPHRDQHRQAAGAGETAAIESPGQRGPGPSLSSSGRLFEAECSAGVKRKAPAALENDRGESHYGLRSD